MYCQFQNKKLVISGNRVMAKSYAKINLSLYVLEFAKMQALPHPVFPIRQ